jgi:2-methylfumaryl-CoA hydratase
MKNKANSGNFFEAFYLGQQLQHPTPRTITSGDVALYIALTGSRFILQSSTQVAKSVKHNAQLVDDLLVFHIAFGKTVADISVNAIANLGYADVQFLLPVYVEDTLTVSSDVIGLRENKNGKSGIVYVHSTAMNQMVMQF